MRILVAEDEVRLATLLEQSLVEAGWMVDVHHDGRDALCAALSEGGVLFDVMLWTGSCPGWPG